MITTATSLKTYSHKDLAQMAKQGGVRGWHSMRKDQLVKALLTSARVKSTKPQTLKKPAAPLRRSGKNGTVAVRPLLRPAPVRKTTNPRVLKHLDQVKAKFDRSKSLATPNGRAHKNGRLKDRLIVMVRDPFWLHVYWELTRQSVERAQAAMAQEWHTARPFIRLLEVTDGAATSASERVVRDIEVHGGVSNWYVHVDDPPKSYRLEIGYLCHNGKFFSLARSNVVSTPCPGSSDAIDQNWTPVAEDFDKIYAMSGGYSPDGNSTELQELFEERLRRPMGSPMVTRYGVGIDGLLGAARKLDFEVDAEMIIFGTTVPNAHVTLRGEPVRLRPDGTFTVRMSLPNQRQVIPVVACSADGGEQRTIVIAIERNTKMMEPVIRESSE